MPRKDPAANRKWRREHYAASAAVRAGVKASRVKWENSSPEHKASVLEDLRQRRVAVRDFVRAHKMRVGCADCGYCSNAAALDLHHHGTEKNDSVAMMRSIPRARAEIALCTVLCANCHRIHHHNEREALRASK